MLRAVALALRVLMLRAVALALRVLMLRAVALALRVALAFAPLILLMAARYRACIRSAHVCLRSSSRMRSVFWTSRFS
jgi:hypothetical protein